MFWRVFVWALGLVLHKQVNKLILWLKDNPPGKSKQPKEEKTNKSPPVKGDARQGQVSNSNNRTSAGRSSSPTRRKAMQSNRMPAIVGAVLALVGILAIGWPFELLGKVLDNAGITQIIQIVLLVVLAGCAVYSGIVLDKSGEVVDTAVKWVLVPVFVLLTFGLMASIGWTGLRGNDFRTVLTTVLGAALLEFLLVFFAEGISTSGGYSSRSYSSSSTSRTSAPASSYSAPASSRPATPSASVDPAATSGWDPNWIIPERRGTPGLSTPSTGSGAGPAAGDNDDEDDNGYPGSLRPRS